MDIRLDDIFNQEFEIINSGYSTGEYNMKFDYDRTVAVSEAKSLPMFRIYAWKPWAVSLGFNQKETDIDKAECEKRSIEIVRRPTGGRAVLHAEELTYSLVMIMPEGKTVQDIYRDIHLYFLESFRKIGINGLEFEKSQANFREFYKNNDSSVSCFASSARYEIAYNNRKVIGSAQRLFGKVLLQHGSILISKGHEQLADIISNADSEKKLKLKNWIIEHSATLEDVASRKLSFQECANAILSLK
jgi:lipoate-protein ligase A